jgi:hypothetical protein
VVSVIPLFTNHKDEYMGFNAFWNQALPKYRILQDVFLLLPSFLCVALALFVPSFCLVFEGFLQISVVNFTCKLQQSAYYYFKLIALVLLLQERRPRVSTVGWRKMFGDKRQEERGGWRKCVRRGFVICTAHQVLFG